MKPRARKQKPTAYVCRGGPFNGQTLMLTSGGTIPFKLTVHGVNYAGRYDGSMNWIASNQQG